MLTPVGWHHYLVLLVIPFVQMVASAEAGRSSSRAIWMAALAYFLSAISLRAFSRFMVPPKPDTIFDGSVSWKSGWRAMQLHGQIAQVTHGTADPAQVGDCHPQERWKARWSPLKRSD